MISTNLALVDPGPLRRPAPEHADRRVRRPGSDLSNPTPEEADALGVDDDVRGRRLRVHEDPVDEAADDRLLARRLARRPCGLDRREVPYLVRLRRRRRARVHPRPAHRQPDDVLAHRDRALVGPHVLRDDEERELRDLAGSGSRPRRVAHASRARSSGRRARGSSSPTTWSTGPRCHAAGTSRRWSSPSCSPPTCASSSGASADGPVRGTGRGRHRRGERDRSGSRAPCREEGMHVVVADVEHGALEATATELRDGGAEVLVGADRRVGRRRGRGAGGRRVRALRRRPPAVQQRGGLPGRRRVAAHARRTGTG